MLQEMYLLEVFFALGVELYLMLAESGKNCYYV